MLDSSLAPVYESPFKPVRCACHGMETTRLDGTHTVSENDGRMYSGSWAEGEWHGRGKWTHPSLGEYEGEWSQGVFDGLGTLTWADGKMLHGHFKDGCPVSGILLDTNGDSMQVWYSGDQQAFAAPTPIRSKAVKVEDLESWEDVCS
mmetsp:Transcript_40175/g.80963  ORF Transcript_40175/g.80963 Transcript_40175/m.80963 type:complete len:147 (-) Transcript_40175:57-497(-)